MVGIVFVLLKQYFATNLACFGRFVLINLACESNGRFSDTVTVLEHSEEKPYCARAQYGSRANLHSPQNRPADHHENYRSLYEWSTRNSALMRNMGVTEAYKVFGRMKEKNEIPELPPPPELKAEIKIRHTDALTFLADWPDQSVDLLLTDPPYMTDIDGDFYQFVKGWTEAALPKLKPSAQAYICTGSYPLELGDYIAVLRSQDYMELVDVLVWEYRNTLGPKPKNNYKRNWQAILYLRGPEAPPLDCPIMLEQFSVKNINAPGGFGNPNERRLHPWQKPDDLAEQFVRHGSAGGDTVIDPFAGTGTFLLQAAKWGRNAYGAEIDQDVLQIAMDRGGLGGYDG